MNVRHFSVLLAALIAAGCTSRIQNAPEIRVHLPRVDFKIDPQQMEDAYSMLIVSQLYRGLLRFDPTGNVVPSLAESWTESSDRLTYRFKLREARFSNGQAITARHVQQSFARLFFIGAAMSADIDYISGALEFVKTHDLGRLGIRIISDREVEFRLSQPSSLFLKQIAVADCAVLPLTSFRDKLSETEDGVFSGPFRILSMSKGSYVLEKWRKDEFDSPSPPSKIFFFATDQDPIALATSGQTDTLDRDPVTPAQATLLKSNGWGMVPTELTGETFVILNPRFIPKDVRRYLVERVNPKDLVKILGLPQYQPAFGLIPAGFPGELAESEKGYGSVGISAYKGRKTSFSLDYDPSSDWEKKTAEYLRSVWSNESIEVKLNKLSKGEKLQRMFSKTSEAVLGHKGIDYPDGFSVLTYFKGKYDSNYFHVDDPEIDRALAATLRNFDTNSRATSYKKIQKQILSHQTVVPLFFGSQASGFWSHRVRSAPSHPMGYHTMAFESIEMRSQ